MPYTYAITRIGIAHMQKMTWVVVLGVVLAVLCGAWLYIQQQASKPAPEDPPIMLGVDGSVSQRAIDGLGSGAAPSGPQN